MGLYSDRLLAITAGCVAVFRAGARHHADELRTHRREVPQRQRRLRGAGTEAKVLPDGSRSLDLPGRRR